MYMCDIKIYIYIYTYIYIYIHILRNVYVTDIRRKYGADKLQKKENASHSALYNEKNNSFAKSRKY